MWAPAAQCKHSPPVHALTQAHVISFSQPHFEESRLETGSLVSPHQLMHWAQLLSPPQPGGRDVRVCVWRYWQCMHGSDAQQPCLEPQMAPSSRSSPHTRPSPGTPALHPATAMPILSELAHYDIDLTTLDSTDLSRAVTALRRHPDAGVAHLAGHVTSRWRSSALNVLNQVAAQ